MAGTGLTQPFRSVTLIDTRVAYYASEMFGIELFYSFLFNKENNNFAALKLVSGGLTVPIVREIQSQYGALLHYVPWYAKINFFNQILYFDWYLSGGAGTLKTALDTRANANSPAVYVNQDLFALYAGTGHQYHLTNAITVRLDFTGAFYRAPLGGDKGDQTWFSNYTFVVGLGLKI